MSGRKSVRVYLNQNVYDAALERINWIFDEFQNVIVNISGGKDSTVVRNLALKVAEERGRLPLKVFHIDLEDEWNVITQHLRDIYADRRIEPLWLQIPLKKNINAAAAGNPNFYAWEPGVQWVREKETYAITENVYGVERYEDVFVAFDRYHYHGVPTARIAGVRAEESPARRMGLTSYETYKGVTWGNKHGGKDMHFTFYPIYDWSYTDVWKAIHDNSWPYCPIYDWQYQHGVPIQNMRVSGVLHETAVRSLFYMQEIEPDTWNILTRRANGVNSAGQLQSGFKRPEKLPFMFKDWREYRDYLLENLITNEKERAVFRRMHELNDARYEDVALEDLYKKEIDAMLENDIGGSKLSMFAASHGRHLKGAFSRGGSLALKD